MDGYAGKILYVDLTTGESRTEPLPEKMAGDFLGGAGFGIKMITDLQRPGTDAFDPENPIVFSLGTFCGVMVPGASSKWGVAGKSPQSNALGEAYSTGFFGAEMRRAGYDIVVVTGKAKSPIYLYIENESVQLMDASHLWGKDNWETETMIKEELGDPGVRLASIGPAGENLVRFACIINDRLRAAGRTGMGAIMGSKNFKAIAVRGTADITVADVEKFKELSFEMYKRAKGPATEKYRGLGTAGNVLVLNKAAAMPTRNWQDAVFEGAEKISGEFMNEHYVTKIQGCDACGSRCEHVASVNEGPYKGSYARVEYEPIYALGSCTGVDRADAIIRSVQLCDLYGLDALSAGVVVAFGMELFEKGLITKKDTGGIDLRFGNHEAQNEMLRKIAFREDIGDILAEGVARAAEKIGKGSETFAMHIKGVEMTGYDVRGLKTCALGYAVSRRGADHQRHGAYGPDLKGTVDRFSVDKGRGQLVIDGEDVYSVIDSLILCKFNRGIWNYDEMAQMYTHVTGLPMTGEKIRLAGERISNLARVYNIREGLGRADDNLPIRCMTDPIKSGVAKGSLVTRDELDILLDGYYESRGWTNEGVPTKAKMDELDLSEYYEYLEGVVKKPKARKAKGKGRAK
ncbi:MAG: aldehyde ferredoxin oxidoreductase family protein [Candidatus Thorarchaeota archaeon]